MSLIVTKTVSKDDLFSYEREVDRIVLTQGKILVSDRGTDTILEGDATYKANGSSDISIHALEASSLSVAFLDDPVIPIPRPAAKSDLADSLDIEELRRLARERQIPGYETLSRADLIAQLGA